MDNRDRIKINVNNSNEMPHSSRRVPTEPGSLRADGTAATRPGSVPGASRLDPNASRRPQKSLSKKRKISIAALVIGIIVLVAGLGFFLWRLLSTPALDDADYLVQIGSWQRGDAPSVIWDFTEIGQGRLTTNDHVNDYDFTWAIEDGQLKIDTDWLYTMNDAYTYHLDQNANQLKLEIDDETLVFVPESAESDSDNRNASQSSPDDTDGTDDTDDTDSTTND